MRRTGTALLALALAGLASGAAAQTGDPDRTRRQEALAHAVAIQNAWASVEARIRVTDAANLWEDEWTGLAAPPSGSWWLGSWTERGLTARYCGGVLAVYAATDELKGVGRGHREVQVAPVRHGGGRTGLHVILKGTRIAKGAHGRDDTGLPLCMGIPSTGEDRVGLVGAVADPVRTVAGIRWETERRNQLCPGSTGTCGQAGVNCYREARQVPIQATAVTNCPATAPDCNDLSKTAPSAPHLWPRDCALRTGLGARAACTGWRHAGGLCPFQFAQATPPTPIPDPVIAWRPAPVLRTTGSCNCPSGQTGTCTLHYEQNTEYRDFQVRPGAPVVTTRRPARVNGARRLVRRVRNCSAVPVGPTNPGTPTNPNNPVTPGTPNTPTNPQNPVTPTNTNTNPQNPNPNKQQPDDDDPGGPDGNDDDGTSGGTSSGGTSGGGTSSSSGGGHVGGIGGFHGTSDANSGVAPGDPGHGSQGNSNSNTDGTDTGNANGGGGGGKPIMLDLDGDGVELVPLEESTAFFDINGDGYRERMAWASADDGFLAYDKDGDGRIAEHDELSFVSYVPGARTDLEGLRHFDTDGDGLLDPDDAEWAMFRVWQDLDQDGESDPGELRGLDEAGIESVSLTSDGARRTVAGNTIFGEGEYVGPHGPRAFWDVSLRIGERKE